MEKFYAALGQFLKKQRKTKGLPQEALAEVLKINRVSVSNIESGLCQLPLHRAIELADALGFPFEEIIGLYRRQKLENQLKKQPFDIRESLRRVLREEDIK